jgi:hypothetical protein
MQEKTCVRTTSLQKRNSEAAAALSYEMEARIILSVPTAVPGQSLRRVLSLSLVTLL